MNQQKRRAREKLAAAVKNRDFERNFASAQNFCRCAPCCLSHRRRYFKICLAGDLQNLAGTLRFFRAPLEFAASAFLGYVSQ